MIRTGESKYIVALKEMWKLCFPLDTDEFVRFYFDRVYRDEESLVYISEENEPAAFLQMIPYRIKKGNILYWGGYLSGVMVHPAYQRKGYMEKLLNVAIERMRSKGYDYAFLIPQSDALVKYYELFDFKLLASSRHKHIENIHPISMVGRLIQPASPHAVRINRMADYRIYSRLITRKEYTVLKTDQQFFYVLQDFFDENGVLFSSDEGIAFAIKKGYQVFLKEFLCLSKDIENEFLKTIRQYYYINDIVFPNENRGMIKRLNPSVENINYLYLGMMLD
jgi:predicted acetyltransferase